MANLSIMGSCYSNQIVFQDGQRLVPIYDRQMGDMVGLALVDAKSKKKKRLNIPKFKEESPQNSEESADD